MVSFTFTFYFYFPFQFQNRDQESWQDQERFHSLSLFISNSFSISKYAPLSREVSFSFTFYFHFPFQFQNRDQDQERFLSLSFFCFHFSSISDSNFYFLFTFFSDHWILAILRQLVSLTHIKRKECGFIVGWDSLAPKISFLLIFCPSNDLVQVWSQSDLGTCQTQVSSSHYDLLCQSSQTKITKSFLFYIFLAFINIVIRAQQVGVCQY